MISTVTTTTVTTITALATAGSLAVFGIVLLLVFLAQKELASATENRAAHTLSRVLNIAIVPMFFVFAFIVVARVVELIQ
jgi:hypothetical protein